MSTKNVIVLTILTTVAYVMRLEYFSDQTSSPADDLNLDCFELSVVTKSRAENQRKMTSTKDLDQTEILKEHDFSRKSSKKASLVNIMSRSKLNRQLKQQKSSIKRQPSWEGLTYSKNNPTLICRSEKLPSIKKSSSNPTLLPQKESLMQLISSPQ